MIFCLAWFLCLHPGIFLLSHCSIWVNVHILKERYWAKFLRVFKRRVLFVPTSLHTTCIKRGNKDLDFPMREICEMTPLFKPASSWMRVSIFSLSHAFFSSSSPSFFSQIPETIQFGLLRFLSSSSVKIESLPALNISHYHSRVAILSSMESTRCVSSFSIVEI